MKIIVIALSCACLSITPSVLRAQPVDGPDGWTHSLAIYLWGASVGGKTNSGGDLDVSFEDLLENLEFGAMGAYQAKKGKWSLMTDLIYLDEANEKTRMGDRLPVELQSSVELESWVVQAGVSYALWESQEGSMVGLVFGARYLDMGAEIILDLQTPLPGESPPLDLKVSDHVFDFYAGLHGAVALNDRWFIPWSVNAGTGDSRLSWAALAGVGFNASERTEILLSYRHHAWDFDDTLIISELEFSGPMLGAVFRF